MPLLRNGEIDHTVWSHHSLEGKVDTHQFVTLQDYLAQSQTWQALDGPWTVEVQPDDDLDDLPKELLTHQHLAIVFPVFTDGRGYSHARQLRHFYGYKGELIATGDVRRDQIDFMARVGIDSFECSADVDVADWNKALIELRVAS